MVRGWDRGVGRVVLGWSWGVGWVVRGWDRGVGRVVLGWSQGVGWLVRDGVDGGDGDGGVVEWLCGEKNITHNHLKMYLTVACSRCRRWSTSSSVEISCKK